ncbi:dipeptidase [Desulfotomaculum copahuensis]|uniref:Peptidase n=1 Tax=Desulfotomaculum copahuensis TaxID=1838280 RepID=A0A1B7LJE5_9FIRM|nr:dipeptidase [Desulfotomaculum copahuensis]OAT86700.1 peptidase [Desulfotomaculum copahuensis]
MIEHTDLHRRLTVVDAHCDFLSAAEKNRRRLSGGCGGHVDLPRLKKGGVSLQFFAAFVPPEERELALIRVMEQIDFFYRELAENADAIMSVYNYPDIEKACAQGKIGALLSLEGGDALTGRLTVLRMLYRLGLRSITLTWNGRNELADGVGESGTRGGLTRFGREAVKEMNRLGILIDVSHLAEPGFWDVLAVSGGPLIASHANSRRLCSHPRNLSDDQIRALSARGGVIGLCFYPPFVDADNATLERLLDHAEHIISVGGVECLGLGSDFDGIESTLAGLEDVSCLPRLTEGLARRGYPEEDISRIMGGNFLRVLKTVLK